MRDYQPFMVVRTNPNPNPNQILLSTYLHANNAACYNFMNAGGRLSSCGTLALPHGMWNIPRQGSEPVSPVLADGFLSAGPSDKSEHESFIVDSKHAHSLLCLSLFSRP